MRRFGERILWRRTQDYLATYKPLVVGVAGSAHLPLTQEAVRSTLALTCNVYAPKITGTATLDVALTILGVESLSAQAGWFKLLTGSLIREIKEPEADTLVLELATHRPGDMDFLATLLPVDVAIVTNIDSTATQYFGSKEFVAHEVMPLVVSLKAKGLAILNADDPLILGMSEHTKARVVTFGHSPKADVKLMRATRLSSGGFVSEIMVGGKMYELHQKHLLSRRQLETSLAALALAHAMNSDMAQTVARLAALTPPAGCLKQETLRHSAAILDDSREASPESMMAALETLRALPARRKIAVLGDIGELGGESVLVHRTVGHLTGQVAQVAIFVGYNMREAGKRALSAGIDMHHFDQAADVGKWLEDFLHEGDLVLICGGREMQMGEIVRRLL